MKDQCPHQPGFIDRVLYYFHIIVEPCRFVSHTSNKFILSCLTTDWIEMGLMCPRCINTELGDYVIVHPDEEDFEEEEEDE